MGSTWNIAIASQDITYPHWERTKGVVDYGASHPGFRFQSFRFLHDEEVPRQLRRGTFDGAIVSLRQPVYEQLAGEFPKLPTVNIGTEQLAAHIPLVRGLPGEGSQVLLDHLRGQGYQRFAYVAKLPLGEQNQRIGNLRRRMQDSEGPLAACCIPPYDLESDDEPRLEQITEWLRETLDPAVRTGIIAYDGDRAALAIAACHRQELAIPAQVGIVAYKETPACLTTLPAITVADPPDYEAGYAAMHLLHQMLEGKAPPREPVEIRGCRVIVRGSTAEPDVYRDEIQAAVEFLEKNFTRRITVDDCRAHLGNVAHTSFYRSFKQQMGVPPGEYLRNLKVKLAKDLLITTPFAVSRVAELCGFTSLEQLDNTFKLVVGKTPRQYRNGMQGNGKKRRSKGVGG